MSSRTPRTRRLGRFIGGTAGGRLVLRRPAAASRSRAASTPPRVQTPVSGSTSSTRSAASLVAGNVGGDRADLLVSGHHQEGRRTAIGLHAGEIEAGLVLREFARAMRTHRAAAMLVGIDQRRQRDRRTRSRDRAAGAVRAGNERSGRKPVATTSSSTMTLRAPQQARGRRSRGAPSAMRCETRNPVSTLILPAATSAAKCAPSSPRAASLSLAPPPNALAGSLPRSSQIGLRARRFVRKLHEIDQRADRGMAGAEHRDGLAGVAGTVAAEHVRHAVGDRSAASRLADRRQDRWRPPDWARTRCRTRRSRRRRAAIFGPLPF